MIETPSLINNCFLFLILVEKSIKAFLIVICPIITYGNNKLSKKQFINTLISSHLQTLTMTDDKFFT